jgi:CDP-diglyceride synthetase
MKTRILTATVLILGVLWIVFFAPAIIFTLLLGLFLAGAAWEWAGLIPGRRNSMENTPCTPLFKGGNHSFATVFCQL